MAFVGSPYLIAIHFPTPLCVLLSYIAISIDKYLSPHTSFRSTSRTGIIALSVAPSTSNVRMPLQFHHSKYEIQSYEFVSHRIIYSLSSIHIHTHIIHITLFAQAVNSTLLVRAWSVCTSWVCESECLSGLLLIHSSTRSKYQYQPSRERVRIGWLIILYYAVLAGNELSTTLCSIYLMMKL